jgi:hypothetical protein
MTEPLQTMYPTIEQQPQYSVCILHSSRYDRGSLNSER